MVDSPEDIIDDIDNIGFLDNIIMWITEPWWHIAIVIGVALLILDFILLVYRKKKPVDLFVIKGGMVILRNAWSIFLGIFKIILTAGFPWNFLVYLVIALIMLLIGWLESDIVDIPEGQWWKQQFRYIGDGFSISIDWIKGLFSTEDVV